MREIAYVFTENATIGLAGLLADSRLSFLLDPESIGCIRMATVVRPAEMEPSAFVDLAFVLANQHLTGTDYDCAVQHGPKLRSLTYECGRIPSECEDIARIHLAWVGGSEVRWVPVWFSIPGLEGRYWERINPNALGQAGPSFELHKAIEMRKWREQLG